MVKHRLLCRTKSIGGAQRFDCGRIYTHSSFKRKFDSVVERINRPNQIILILAADTILRWPTDWRRMEGFRPQACAAATRLPG
jgi:hypothetical protein